MRQHIKKQNLRLLDEVYQSIGCTKTDISRWKYNAASTHASVKKHKETVIRKAAVLFELSEAQAEMLANKAGLSLRPRENGLAKLLEKCGREQRRLLYQTAVSERMIQYYIAGKESTKQALIAIAVLFELRLQEIEKLLEQYGYCLSYSLEYDLVIRWCLENRTGSGGERILYSINETLYGLKLPLLMTKSINRSSQ